MSRTLRSTIVCLIACAFAAPGVAGAQDLRSPDARDAAATSSLAGTPSKTTDLRSPDAVDAAAGRGTFNAPQVKVVKVSQPVHADSGVDWADAGIGAAILLGAMGLAGAVAIVHRRRHHPAAV